jgi:hypothetical protein
MTAIPSLRAVPGALEIASRCPCCLQAYAYEMEVRCVDCDGPACSLCVLDLLMGQGAPGAWRCATCLALVECE